MTSGDLVLCLGDMIFFTGYIWLFTEYDWREFVYHLWIISWKLIEKSQDHELDLWSCLLQTTLPKIKMIGQMVLEELTFEHTHRVSFAINNINYNPHAIAQPSTDAHPGIARRLCGDRELNLGYNPYCTVIGQASCRHRAGIGRFPECHLPMISRHP